MSKTQDNLAQAFAGESQANRKYLAFAKQADKEGRTRIARLFRAVAAAETVHAHNHLDIMGQVGSTEENLRHALDGEVWEFSDMYPPMIEEAEADGEKKAARTFTYANEVEKIHAQLYQEALENVDAEQEDVAYHVCKVCGYTVENDPPERCPVCNAGQKAFFEVQ
jgi:rubrerythrin